MHLQAAICIAAAVYSATASPVASAATAMEKRPDASQNAYFPTSCKCTCEGTKFKDASDEDKKMYICGDKRLGPKKPPVGIILARIAGDQSGYDPLDENGLDQDGWNYPQKDGFLLDNKKERIEGWYMVEKGTLVDRFGSPGGGFLAPYGAPFQSRALPPDSLNTGSDGDKYPADYHIYEVKNPFKVKAGTIAPWFGQDSFGTQYWLEYKKDGTKVKVQDYINDGTLVEVTDEKRKEEQCQPSCPYWEDDKNQGFTCSRYDDVASPPVDTIEQSREEAIDRQCQEELDRDIAEAREMEEVERAIKEMNKIADELIADDEKSQAELKKLIDQFEAEYRRSTGRY